MIESVTSPTTRPPSFILFLVVLFYFISDVLFLVSVAVHVVNREMLSLTASI